eukprot:TRINITY_DN24625_c0_g1_i1.p2 TRINITY_DN24625_c0_g1~~TRINITY_DN24625_c0_g1_i1.p2  ORF type:complete len:162 (-),score=33.20 TRINITY_DN24625_c0_g1_i1:182-667(-)
MAAPKHSMMFVNLAVKNLKTSVEFFTKLGYTFEPRFTDEHGTCMNVGESFKVMLLEEPFFRTFTKKQLVDTKTHVELLLCVSCESRAAVDDLAAKAVAAGGQRHEFKDYGFMYGTSFEDLDAHVWELSWMDPDWVSGKKECAVECGPGKKECAAPESASSS